MSAKKPRVGASAVAPAAPLPKQDAARVTADQRQPGANARQPRHRLAGSHDGMYITEHHRGRKRQMHEGLPAAVRDPETGIAIRFIRSFDPETARVPTAVDVDVWRRLRLEAFLKTAPDYDPAIHDAEIRRMVWGADV